MRYFLYTYVSAQNWDTTRKAGVFGTKKDATGLPTKVKALRRGDLIIIRDGSRQDFTVLGACIVNGDVFDQSQYSPYKDLLWEDEKQTNTTTYPLRVPVETKLVPKLNLTALTWTALDSLGFHNAAGDPLRGHQAWGKKFVGNFLESEFEVKSFSKLLEHTAA
jgi:hypothetical protein